MSKSTTATTTTTTENTTTTATETINNEKTNVVFTEYKSLYNDLCKCNTKHGLVDTINKYGLRTTTQPTDTINKNDLYIQFASEKSRILITTRSLKLYTCDTIASDDYFSDMKFDIVNDGSYRTKRCTVSNTVDNFKKFFEYFLTMVDGHENNFLPTK